ncbi:hypothetical protein V9K67_03930 [Paraflavisolibacter sp. H34]|uniref:hypothetical protein n=1 Tax=Huijunlia imazamoxiresistens TaxID=3127457 RepID=UPI00301788C1
MKYLISVSIIITLGSCGSAQKLLEKNTDDGGKVVIKKELCCGIDYLYLEKKNKGKVVYSIFYNCECSGNKVMLRKTVGNDEKRTLWNGVTDTTVLPKFFDEPIASNRLVTPFEFMPITKEEQNLIEEGLNKVDKECCKVPDKPFKMIIGYVRVKTN